MQATLEIDVVLFKYEYRKLAFDYNVYFSNTIVVFLFMDIAQYYNQSKFLLLNILNQVLLYNCFVTGEISRLL